MLFQEGDCRYCAFKCFVDNGTIENSCECERKRLGHIVQFRITDLLTLNKLTMKARKLYCNVENLLCIINTAFYPNHGGKTRSYEECNRGCLNYIIYTKTRGCYIDYIVKTPTSAFFI